MRIAARVGSGRNASCRASPERLRNSVPSVSRKIVHSRSRSRRKLQELRMRPQDELLGGRLRTRWPISQRSPSATGVGGPARRDSCVRGSSQPLLVGDVEARGAGQRLARLADGDHRPDRRKWPAPARAWRPAPPSRRSRAGRSSPRAGRCRRSANRGSAAGCPRPTAPARRRVPLRCAAPAEHVHHRRDEEGKRRQPERGHDDGGAAPEAPPRPRDILRSGR